MGGSGGVEAEKQSGALQCKKGQHFDLLHKGLLVSFQLELHVDLAIMHLVLLPKVVFVDHAYGLLVLLR